MIESASADYHVVLDGNRLGTPHEWTQTSAMPEVRATVRSNIKSPPARKRSGWVLLSDSRRSAPSPSTLSTRRFWD